MSTDWATICDAAERVEVAAPAGRTPSPAAAAAMRSLRSTTRGQGTGAVGDPPTSDRPGPCAADVPTTVPHRLFGLLAFAALALVFAAPALAKPGSEMEVYEYQGGLGQKAGIDIALHVATDRAPAAHAVIYAPWYYKLDTSQKIGSRIGYTNVTMYRGAKAVFGTGEIVVSNPDAYVNVNNDCAPGKHLAVWLMRIAIDNSVLEVPLFVDRGEFDSTLQASYTLTGCFGAPAATRGLRLVWLDVVTGAFTNPPEKFTYLWRALVTSYGADNAPDPGSAFEVQSNVELPGAVTLKTHYDAARGVVTLSGTVIAGGEPWGGETVSFFSPAKPPSTTPFRTVPVDRTGRFSFSTPWKKTAWIQASAAIMIARDCVPSTDTAPCVYATFSPPPDGWAKVVVPKS